MLEFSQRRRLRRAIYSKPVAVGLFIFVCFLGYTTFGMYQTAREAGLRRQTAAADLAKLEERERFLKSEIERLKTERGIEEEVREKYDVAKEGEKVIVIVEEKSTSTNSSAKKHTGVFGSFWSWIRGKK